ncbi:MAG: alpha/beta hydrolase [Bdellovibrionaceae bacterium]|nr:alpha/beta hydrolase [Pseudobdellovibrionaceae bacterium]
MRTLFALLLLIPAWSWAQAPRTWQKGLTTLNDGVPRYVEYLPAAPGKSTLVFTNGLVYDLRRWRDLTAKLEEKGYGVVLYYFRGQHRTLLAETETFGKPKFFRDGLEGGDFTDELFQLTEALGLKKTTVVGLSYGAHIAARYADAHPDRVERLVFLAPLVVSLDKYDAQGAWIMQSLDWIKLWWGPFLGPYFYESAYRQIYSSYLAQRILPDRVPEELREIPDIYRESVFHLIRAVRSFDLRELEFKKLPAGSVTYILAQEDEKRAFEDQLKAARNVSPGRLQQLIYMPNSSHAIPDSQGAAAAHLLDLLIRDDARLQRGGASILDGDTLRPWTEAP